MARVLLVYPNRNRQGLTPIGLTLAAAVLKQRGHEVRLFDTTFLDTTGLFASANERVYTEKMEQLLFFKPVDLAIHGVAQERADVPARLRELVGAFRPHLIAFSFWSCQLTGEDEGMMYWRGRELLRRAGCTAAATGSAVVAGGIYPSLAPGEVLADGVTSHVCRGEGELVYAEMAEAVDRQRPLEEIDNLAWRDGDRIRCNPLRPLVELDSLPAGDFSIYDPRSFLRPFHGRVIRGLDYELTRGCVNECAYCVGPALRSLYPMGPARRERSVTRIIAEIGELRRTWRLDLVRLQDELFLGMAIPKLRELATAWRRRLGLPFIIETSVASLNEETMALLKEMGCLSVSVGIEHGDESFRTRILNKHYANEQAVSAFRGLRAAGIYTHAYAMLGFPGETRELAMSTVGLLRDLRPDTFQVSLFQPFQGTALWRRCCDTGRCDPAAAPREFVGGSVLDNPELPPAELAGLFRAFSLYVLLPRRLWAAVRAAETDDGVYRRLLPLGQRLINRGRA